MISCCFNSGKESKTVKAKAKELFNDDNSDKKIILVNSGAGNSGISLHDTTGKHQRVLLNLGIPVRPTFAIQIEGRIYRVGLQSDAIFRYMSTGLAMERYMVASKLAARAGTAENLAMGNDARALEDAYVQAYQDAANYWPSLTEGTGGKARDRQTDNDTTNFDKAKTYFFARQKRTQQTKAREGNDYFATPDPLGLKMVDWLNVEPGDSLLEPSAGDGAIARWMPDNANIHTVEPSYELASKLSLNAPTAKIIQNSFEDLPAQNKYDGIAMNPPYGAGSKTAIEHTAKAFNHLRDGGRLITLIPQGPASDKKLNKWLDDEKTVGAQVVAEITLPPGVFDRAGTGVATRVLIIDKNMDPEAETVYKETQNLHMDNIKDFFEQIEHMEFDRTRPEPKSLEERANSEIQENPQAWLETKGLDVTDQGGGHFTISGSKTKEYKDILRKAGGNWDASLKEWDFYNDNPSQTVAELINRRQQSPYAEIGIEVVEEQGKFYVSGSGTKRVKETLKKHGARWNRDSVSWAMNEDPAPLLDDFMGDKARYALTDPMAGTKPKGLKPYQTKSMQQQLTKAIGNMATVVQNESDLPKHLYDQIKADSVQGRVKGVYDPQNDTVYVIAGNVDNFSDGLRTALHEAVGHKGLRGVLGKQLNTTLDQIYNSLPESMVRQLRKEYANQIAGKSQEDQRRIVTEEYLAHLAEEQPNNNLVQRVIAKIRSWMRRALPGLKWSDGDIRDLMIQASQQAKEAPAESTTDTAPEIQDTPDSARYKTAMFANGDAAQTKELIGKNAESLMEAIRSKSLGWLGGRQMTDLYSKLFEKLEGLNPLKAIGDMTQKLSATRNFWANAADKIDNKWARLAGNKVLYKIVNDLMYESTIAEVDPSWKQFEPKYDRYKLENEHKSASIVGDTKTMLKIDEQLKEDEAREKAYNELSARYKPLDKSAKEVFTSVRDYYETQWKATKAALDERINGMELDGTTKAGIRKQVEALFHKSISQGAYFPLMRFGEFAAIGETPEGEPFRQHYESLKDMKDGIKSLESKGYIIESSGKVARMEPSQMSGVTKMTSKIQESLVGGKLGKQLDDKTKMAFMDEINQMALSLLPELSAAKTLHAQKKDCRL